jgi:hypothetical protein
MSIEAYRIFAKYIGWGSCDHSVDSSHRESAPVLVVRGEWQNRLLRSLMIKRDIRRAMYPSDRHVDLRHIEPWYTR